VFILCTLVASLNVIKLRNFYTICMLLVMPDFRSSIHHSKYQVQFYDHLSIKQPLFTLLGIYIVSVSSASL